MDEILHRLRNPGFSMIPLQNANTQRLPTEFLTTTRLVKRKPKVASGEISWMDEILLRLRNHGSPSKMPTGNSFPWFPSGAKRISSIRSILTGLVSRFLSQLGLGGPYSKKILDNRRIGETETQISTLPPPSPLPRTPRKPSTEPWLGSGPVSPDVFGPSGPARSRPSRAPGRPRSRAAGSRPMSQVMYRFFP